MIVSLDRNERFVRRPGLKGLGRGFTLLEVVTVVVILALVMAIATTTMLGPIRRARMTHAIDTLENVDRFARSSARRDNLAYRIVFDRKKRSIQAASTTETKAKNIRMWRLPGGIEMGDFYDADGVNRLSKYEILIAANGTSPGYAVSLGMPGSRKNWLVTFGLSGKQIRLEEDTDVAAIFAPSK